MSASDTQDGVGRAAARPMAIPKRGWWRILKRIWANIGAHNLAVTAGGIAFYLMLSLFPGLAALVALYALAADPAEVQVQMQSLVEVLPDQSEGLMRDQLTRLADTPAATAGWGAAIGVVLALWGATRGTRALMLALNTVYHERESRNWLMLNLAAIGMTVALVLFVAVTLGLVALLPAVMRFLGVGGWAAWAVTILKWPLLIAAVVLAIGAFYRWGPARRPARWRWLTPGSVVATVLWLAGSAGFSVYVGTFGSYSETYGSLAAAVVLMVWFLITAYAILLGAEIDAAIEHQTAVDTTVGPDRPMGQRGAVVADTLPDPAAADEEPEDGAGQAARRPDADSEPEPEHTDRAVAGAVAPDAEPDSAAGTETARPR
jgi:membrane protein